MLPPEILKRKLLKLDTDRNRWTDSGKTICPFHHSQNCRGIKKIQKTSANIGYCRKNAITCVDVSTICANLAREVV